MAIDGIGGSTPLIPPSGDGVQGSDNTNGTGSVTAPIVAKTPTTPPPNILSTAILSPKANASPLDRPKIILPSDTSSLSVGDLIQLIQAEIQKTTDALAEVQNSQIKSDSLRQQAANTSQIEALKSAADQIIEIQKQQEAMEIAQWCMTAFSIFITVCTAGTLGVIAGPLMIAGTVATQVPIEGKNFSGWLTQGVGEGVGQMQKAMLRQMLKDKGIEPTQEAMDKFNSEIENNQEYYAMAIMITLEIAVAVVIAVASLGSTAGPAATGAASAVTQTSASAAANIAARAAETAMKEASQIATKTAETAIRETTKIVEKTAETAVQQATNIASKTVQSATTEAANITAKTVQTTVDKAAKVAETSTKVASESARQLAKIQKAYQVTETIGTVAKDLAMDGVKLHTSYLQYENSQNLASTDQVKAYVKFLQQILSSQQEFLKELIEMQANIASTTKNILQTEHATNMHIANLTTHA
jgi:hypothetical protein